MASTTTVTTTSTIALGAAEPVKKPKSLPKKILGAPASAGRFIYKGLKNHQRRVEDYLVKTNWPQLEERAEGITTVFQDYIPKGSHVLDLGGGWGLYNKPLVKRGHTHTVLDVLKPSITATEVVVYDGKTIPFPDKHFDVTILITMLHHVYGIENLLEEVWRVTKTRVIVVEDVYHKIYERPWVIFRDRLFNAEWLDHPQGFRTVEQWKVLFKKLKFSTIHAHEWVSKLAGINILQGLLVLEPDVQEK